MHNRAISNRVDVGFVVRAYIHSAKWLTLQRTGLPCVPLLVLQTTNKSSLRLSDSTHLFLCNGLQNFYLDDDVDGAKI